MVRLNNAQTIHAVDSYESGMERSNSIHTAMTPTIEHSTIVMNDDVTISMISQLQFIKRQHVIKVVITNVKKLQKEEQGNKSTCFNSSSITKKMIKRLSTIDIMMLMRDDSCQIVIVS
ncbi:hypothetical protein BLOT_003707 [Blomia tropicalis]|nr:hypothetical protein BLOT_003707 [Blomia tropicalis]